MWRKVDRQLGRAEDVDGGQLLAGLSQVVFASQQMVGQVTDDENEMSERRRTVGERDVVVRNWKNINC
jgi:hypothetical protein